MKLAIGLVILTAACATSGLRSKQEAAAGCAAGQNADSTVYDTLQVTRRPERYAGPPPQYPTSAREQLVQGRVLIAFIIEPTGEVNQSSVSVVRSPDARLTESALLVVRQSKFRPGCLGDRAVRVRVALPVDYRIVRGMEAMGRRPGDAGRP
jgi:TonB family protein